MNRHLPFIVAAGLVAATFIMPGKLTPPSGPVAAALASASRSDRAAVRELYRSLADVTRRDQGKLITTTAAWRAVHANSLKLAFGGTTLVGKYAGLDKAVDVIVFPAMGNTVRSMTDSVDGKPLWEKIASACEEVSRQSE